MMISCGTLASMSGCKSALSFMFIDYQTLLRRSAKKCRICSELAEINPILWVVLKAGETLWKT